LLLEAQQTPLTLIVLKGLQSPVSLPYSLLPPIPVGNTMEDDSEDEIQITGVIPAPERRKVESSDAESDDSSNAMENDASPEDDAIQVAKKTLREEILKFLIQQPSSTPRLSM
jgi:hypothetical protein